MSSSGQKRKLQAPNAWIADVNRSFVVVPRYGLSAVQQKIYEGKIREGGGSVADVITLQRSFQCPASDQKQFLVLAGEEATAESVRRDVLTGITPSQATHIVVVKQTWFQNSLGLNSAQKFGEHVVTLFDFATLPPSAATKAAAATVTTTPAATTGAGRGGGLGGWLSMAPKKEGGASSFSAERHWETIPFPRAGPMENDRGIVPLPPNFIPPPHRFLPGGAAPSSSSSSTAASSARAGDSLPSLYVPSGAWQCSSAWRVPFLQMAAADASAARRAAAAARRAAAWRGPRDAAARRVAFAAMSPAGLGECYWAMLVPTASATTAPAASAAAASANAPSGTTTADSAPAAPASVRIAAFDLDGTLISPSDPKARFCNSASDWKEAFPGCFSALRSLAQDGYAIVIFTNQSGVATGKTTLKIVQSRCERVAAAIGVPLTVYVSTSANASFYRKPFPGMWWLLAALGTGGRPIDMPHSIYVGDAAGRPKGTGPAEPKDFAASDLMFALANGVRFATPEAFFQRSRAPRHAQLLGAGRRGGASSSIGASSGSGSSSVGAMSETAWNLSVLGEFVPARDLPPPWYVSADEQSVGGSSSTGSSSGGGGGGGSSASSASRTTAVAATAAVVSSYTSAASASHTTATCISSYTSVRPSAEQEVCVLVGLPGCGKSTVALQLEQGLRSGEGGSGSSSSAPTSSSSASAASLSNHHQQQQQPPRYTRVNQDTLKTREKCVAVARTALASGSSVIIDATNVDASTREVWIGEARRAGVPARAIVWTEGKSAAFHFNALRAASPLTPPADKRTVPDMVIHGMAKKMTIPAPSPSGANLDISSSSSSGAGGGAEGFSSVVHVRTVPGPFVQHRVGGGASSSASSSSSSSSAASGVTVIDDGDDVIEILESTSSDYEPASGTAEDAALDYAEVLAEQLAYAFTD